MPVDRDDFSAATRALLAARVGFRCSKPECRQPTSGPQDDPTKTVNLGVAAHITAATRGGPRYDPSLSPEERSAADNGIWCCQTHAKLVDNDVNRYTVQKLREWKALAEAQARRELEEGTAAAPMPHVGLGLRLSSELPPPFWEMSWESFQGVCRELLDAQSEVSGCGLYGVGGQQQRGIDLLAHRSDGGATVAQCKRYRELQPRNIVKASDGFLEHIDHWKTLDVKRFILFLASDTDRTQLQDQLAVEKGRFRQHGIDYEVWDGNTIANRLGAYRHIANRYLGQQWADRLCGGAPGGTERLPMAAHDATLGLLLADRAAVGEVVDQDTQLRLDTIREIANTGRPLHAMAEIRRLRSETARWERLRPATRARALRMQASILLQRGELAEAERLLQEVTAADAAFDIIALSAQVVAVRQGIDEALELLDGHAGVPESTLRAKLLLDCGRPKEALTALEHALDVSDADVFRWRAFAYLMMREVPQARLNADRALEIAPRSVLRIDAWHSGAQ
jgi:tetratricopeptide (TPR) repeat protein